MVLCANIFLTFFTVLTEFQFHVQWEYALVSQLIGRSYDFIKSYVQIVFFSFWEKNKCIVLMYQEWILFYKQHCFKFPTENCNAPSVFECLFPWIYTQFMYSSTLDGASDMGLLINDVTHFGGRSWICQKENFKITP